MQQASSPAVQRLRALHPATLQTLHHSPDGSLYPHTLPELHNLHSTEYHQQHQHQEHYALSGASQPPPHAIHFEHHDHGLPPSAARYSSFPPAGGYQHASTPRFLNANTAPATTSLPVSAHAHVQQYYPQSLQRGTQQRPLPTAPVRTAPRSESRHVEQVQPSGPLAQAQDWYVCGCLDNNTLLTASLVTMLRSRTMANSKG